MTKSNSIKIAGALFILWGLVLLFASQLSLDTLRYVAIGVLLLTAIFELNYFNRSWRKKLKVEYHLFIALLDISFALMIYSYAENIIDYLAFTSFYALSFGIIELVFAVLALQGKKLQNLFLITNNLLAGIANIIAASFILSTNNNEYFSLALLGIVFIFGGLRHFIYRSIFNMQRILNLIKAGSK